MVQDTGDAMRDVILDDIAHKKRCQVDTHHGIYQIEPVGSRMVKGAGEQLHNLVDNPMEHKCSHRGEETDNQREDDHEHPLADVLHPPFMQALEP